MQSDRMRRLRFFTGRQVIRMPAYRDVLADAEVDDIVAYIQQLSKEETR
jgi:mono/diheme cytochrome c family protein